ncbi:hypothetical protein J3E72DRAFT_437419 [Bipolaris maydis]|uniref:uncharacterized protein n=1 Tax=Cochliobolus heterostrophus TaxID=5016 RepID=UPI0024DAF5BB|nr:hypothetical protein J3E74DRAFT_462204 [Bipolaris maydis]KAJ6200942.1 hypothetical protein J3E72DRAFT_437419 [Bipolaris maydis]KAJ6274446.1 hypothetical protein PSV08DRAFT_358801 [Bipolaris maydis]KAJ6286273.1 hypothetical protein J3E71DRAFT_350016 [Bipolaris maydis]
MPRKSTKETKSAAPRSSSKRPAQETPQRQSKRARATARKSYVDPGTDTDDADEKSTRRLSPSTDGKDGAASDYEDHDGKESSVGSEADVTDSDEDDESKNRKPRGRAAKSLPIQKKNSNEQELWKPGAKLEPGTRVVIKKPKARDAGDTPYLDHTIHPNSLLFLKELAANNDRSWLKLHDPDFRVAFQDFTTFAEKVSEKIIEGDETIPELPVKDVIYRIYRDIRFSKDPTPYKTYFSAAWSRTGRKGPYAHYYVQVQPNGGSFVGGGYWQPDAATLAKIRRDIDRKPHKIKSVLRNRDFRETFLGGVQDDDKKAVKAFTSLSMNQSNALKRNPKGYDHDHKDIDLLRLRNFTIGRTIADEEIVGTGGLERVAEVVRAMVPFITYLNSVVMPDEDTSGSSSEDEDGADEDDDDDGADDGADEEAET